MDNYKWIMTIKIKTLTVCSQSLSVLTVLFTHKVENNANLISFSFVPNGTGFEYNKVRI